MTSPQKLRLPGTHRAVSPETTWARIAPRLGDYGITRVADVTRLDVIGIPVFLAVRPASETLAVSQGKGATPLLAKLSAVMESIELWHAERPTLPSFKAPTTALDLPYALDDLNLRMSAPWMNELRLSWVHARSLIDDRSIPVPLDLVRLSYSGSHFWRPRLFQTSSTGLASGNNSTEACLHGLYEAVERDVMARRLGPDHAEPQVIDPSTIDDDHVCSLIDRLRSAGVEIEIVCLPNRFGVPTFAAYVWSTLFPIVCAGSGSHLNADVALSRALTEAVQSRLTEISSTRDDIPSDFSLMRNACSVAPFRSHSEGVHLRDALRGHGGDREDMAKELREVVERVRGVTGHDPLFLELTDQSVPFSVARVVCPGLVYTEGRMLSA
ncbi:YcaO-like family protein [Kitasatospora sp. NPDC096128]|uniref:YcaO-like family protein n=1 Tax=Kitasatospora sp. NPDC096128 TaxID=3155547 RepID=UPI0033239217